eukprot:2015465-Pleurochrysis_carterae.AAC.2
MMRAYGGRRGQLAPLVSPDATSRLRHDQLSQITRRAALRARYGALRSATRPRIRAQTSTGPGRPASWAEGSLECRPGSRRALAAAEGRQECKLPVGLLLSCQGC